MSGLVLARNSLIQKFPTQFVPDQLTAYFPVGFVRCIDQRVFEEAPKFVPPPERGTINITFFPIPAVMGEEEAMLQFQLLGLRAVNPFVLIGYNCRFSNFARKIPNFTHWKDAEGRWCLVSFAGYNLTIGPAVGDWNEAWYGAGVPIDQPIQPLV